MINNEKNQKQTIYETDVSGVSIKNLETGLWWMKNRKNFKNFFIIILSLFCIITIGYSVFGFLNYYIIGAQEDKKMVTDLVNTNLISPEFLAQRAPKAPALSEVGLLENNPNYDLYAIINNPNSNHFGKFTYCFKNGEEVLKCGEDFILPNQKKFIMALNLKISTRPNNIKLTINNLNWERINKHIIPSWENYKNEHLQIDIKNTSFKPADLSELSEKINLNSLSFSVTNSSAYGFWEAPLSIVLYRSNKIVGVNKYSLKEFSSYAEKEIKITWPGNLNGINKIDIEPDINILDKLNYLEPER